MSDDTDSIKETLRKKREEVQVTAAMKPKGMLSSGSTLLNLACSGNPFRAFVRGGFYLIPGQSSAGKTMIAGTCLAEAAINPRFDEYELVFDNVENGNFFFQKMYGPKICQRIKGFKYDKEGNALPSVTVEEFYYNADDQMRKKSSVIVLDSENALTSEQEQKKFKKKKKAHEEEEDSAGVMSDGKAAVHSRNLRNALAVARETNSILMFLCQSRDAIGFGAKFEPETRSGGRALKFYANLEIWFKKKKNLVRTVNGQARKIGIIAIAQVKKNRFTGKDRTVEFPIYYSTGIDDLGSIVDFLVKEKHWGGAEGGATVEAPEFKFSGSREKLIAKIEEQGRERELQLLAAQVWEEIEAKLVVHRKNKYTQ